MAKRKATEQEIASTERKRRKERGVTKEGTPRGTKPGKSKAASEKEKNLEASRRAAQLKKAAETEPTYINTSSEVSDLSGRATGLAEDVGGGLTANELAESGAYLDITTGGAGDPDIDWGKVQVTQEGMERYKKALSEPKKVRTAKQAAQESSVETRTREQRATAAKASVKPATDLATGRVLPPSVPLNPKQAKQRQSFFTGDTRIRTANPPSQRVVDFDPLTGAPVVRQIPRPSASGVRSLRNTVDIPAQKVADLATGALAAAQWLDQLKGIAQTQTQVDPTKKGSTTPVQTATGETEFVTSDESVRRSTMKEALQSEEGQDILQSEEARKLLGLQRQSPGKPAFSGITSKGVVGSTEVTPEFEANVQAAVKKAEDVKTAPVTDETGLETDYGAPISEVYDEEKAKSIVADFAKKAAGGNRRYEVRQGPKDTPRGKYQTSAIKPLPSGTTPVEDGDVIEGANETERLRNKLAELGPEKGMAMAETLKEASRGRGVVQEPLTKQTESQGLRKVQRELEFEPMAKAHKALSRAAGVDIGSQTADEAAETFSIEEGTKRFIQNELMMPPKTAASQSALAIRNRDARDIGRALDQTRISTLGRATPLNDAQIARIRAGALGPSTEEGRVQAIEEAKKVSEASGRTKGREIANQRYLRRMATQTRYWETNPGEVGAMTIMTGEGKVGSIAGPDRAVKYPETPSSTIQDTATREAILGRMWEPKSVVPDGSGGEVEAPGKYDRRRRVVKPATVWEQPATGMFSAESNRTASMPRPADVEGAASRAAIQATKPEVRQARAALANAPSAIRRAEDGGTGLWNRAETSAFESLVTGWKERARMTSPDVVTGTTIEKGSEATFESPQQVFSREEATRAARKKMGPQFNR